MIVVDQLQILKYLGNVDKKSMRSYYENSQKDCNWDFVEKSQEDSWYLPLLNQSFPEMGLTGQSALIDV